MAVGTNQVALVQFFLNCAIYLATSVPLSYFEFFFIWIAMMKVQGSDVFVVSAHLALASFVRDTLRLEPSSSFLGLLRKTSLAVRIFCTSVFSVVRIFFGEFLVTTRTFVVFWLQQISCVVTFVWRAIKAKFSPIERPSHAFYYECTRKVYSALFAFHIYPSG